MSDTSVTMKAPLPDGSAEVTVVWKAPRGGLRPGDEPVPRMSATLAEITRTNLDGKQHTAKISPEEADAYLAEAHVLHDKVAQMDVNARARKQERAAQQAQPVDLSCPRCQVPREHQGRRDMLYAAKSENIARVDVQRMQPSFTSYEEYVCPQCGSVELFRAGPQHPLTHGA